jgi:hypothetical protein
MDLSIGEDLWPSLHHPRDGHDYEDAVALTGLCHLDLLFNCHKLVTSKHQPKLPHAGAAATRAYAEPVAIRCVAAPPADIHSHPSCLLIHRSQHFTSNHCTPRLPKSLTRELLLNMRTRCRSHRGLRGSLVCQQEHHSICKVNV